MTGATTTLTRAAKLNVTKVEYLKSAVMFLPIILYTPFFFSQWAYPSVRIGSFFLLSTYLFFSTNRYSKNDVYVFCTLISLTILTVLRNQLDLLGLISIGNYCLTIFFGWGLYRYLATSRRRVEVLIGLYVRFFFLVVICSILSVLYFVTLGEFDLFGFKSDIAEHLVTPFGVLFGKHFGFIEVYRSFFYFNEPVFVGLFYAANIVIIGPLLKDKAIFFIRTNLLGGLISMSMTFYVVLFVLYMVKKIKSFFGLITVLIVTFCFWYIIQIMGILSFSSFDDRVERFNLFFAAMSAANTVQLYFGHGVVSQTGFDKAFNSGLTLSIYETGLVGTALQMILLFKLSPSFIIFIFFMLAALVADPIHMPIFWFCIIIAFHKLKDEVTNAKI